MGTNGNKFTMIELVRRMKYQREKSRTRNNDVAMMARIKRNLFGCNPGNDCRIQIEKEMAAIARNDRERWNFDFKREKPIVSPKAQFVWEIASNTKQAQLRQTKITDFFGGKRKLNASSGRKINKSRISSVLHNTSRFSN